MNLLQYLLRWSCKSIVKNPPQTGLRVQSLTFSTELQSTYVSKLKKIPERNIIPLIKTETDLHDKNLINVRISSLLECDKHRWRAFTNASDKHCPCRKKFTGMGYPCPSRAQVYGETLLYFFNKTRMSPLNLWIESVF